MVTKVLPVETMSTEMLFLWISPARGSEKNGFSDYR